MVEFAEEIGSVELRANKPLIVLWAANGRYKTLSNYGGQNDPANMRPLRQFFSLQESDSVEVVALSALLHFFVVSALYVSRYGRRASKNLSSDRFASCLVGIEATIGLLSGCARLARDCAVKWDSYSGVLVLPTTCQRAYIPSNPMPPSPVRDEVSAEVGQRYLPLLFYGSMMVCDRKSSILAN